MAGFKPSVPFSVPLMLLIPTYSSDYGVQTKVYPAPDKGVLIFGSLRTFGGTERESNGLFTVYNTATVETWYRPDIKSNCRLYVCETGETFEILGEPENIEMRNQYLKLKVQQLKGGA